MVNLEINAVFLSNGIHEDEMINYNVCKHNIVSCGCIKSVKAQSLKSIR